MAKKSRFIKKFRQQSAELLETFWRHYFSGHYEKVDAVLYCGVVHLCSNNNTNIPNLDGCLTSYAELGRLCNMDWRCVKEGLVQMCSYGLLRYQVQGRRIFISIGNSGKEEKKQKNVLSPEPPYSNKKKEKKEKSEREERENAHSEILSSFEGESFEHRRQAFMESVRPYVDKYGNETCNEFFAYWSEPTPDGLKMRFELEKTWKVSVRLAKWQRLDLRVGRTEKSGGNKAVSQEFALVRERTRVENEKRRDWEALGACPQWVVKLATSRGFEAVDDTGALYQYINSLVLAGDLTQEQRNDFKVWSERREKLIALYEKKYGEKVKS